MGMGYYGKRAMSNDQYDSFANQDVMQQDDGYLVLLRFVDTLKTMI